MDSQRRTALVDRKERGPTLATRTRTEAWRTRRKITHWWSAQLVALIFCTTDIVQARVDRHQNLSSLHCPNKLSVEMAASALTEGQGGKSATFLSGGVEATTYPDEVQSGHVVNDSCVKEETVKNTKPGRTQGTRSERQLRNRMESKREQRWRANWRPDKHLRVKLGKRCLVGWIRGEGRLRERRNRTLQVQEQEDQRARNRRGRNETERIATLRRMGLRQMHETQLHVQSGMQKMQGPAKQGTEKRRCWRKGPGRHPAVDTTT